MGRVFTEGSSGSDWGVKGSSALAVKVLLLLTLTLILSFGCLGGRQQPSPGPAPGEAPALTEPQKREAPTTPEEMLSHISLKASDFPEGGWAPGPSNASGNTYEVRFFKVEFGFGEISWVVNKVHLYPTPDDAKRDFEEAAAELKEMVAVANAGIGEESLSWKKGTEAYVLFVEKGVAVELYFNGPGTYGLEYLKDLARNIEERI